MTKMYVPDSVLCRVKKDNVAFTQKLGFLSYTDDKGKIRKEKAFTDWGNATEKTKTLVNRPRTGFLINRHIDHIAYDFGNDRVRFRVFCPEDDGFEFEITPMNLSYILSVADISKREITEPCVFAWLDNELMLLPTNSQHYRDAMENTERRNNFKDIQKKQGVAAGESFKFGDVLQTKTGNYVLFLGQKKFIFAKELEKSLKKLNPENMKIVNGSVQMSCDADEPFLALQLKESGSDGNKYTFIHNTPYSYVRINPKSYMLADRTFDSFNPTEKLQSIKRKFEANDSYQDYQSFVQKNTISKDKFNTVINFADLNVEPVIYAYGNNELTKLSFDGKKSFNVRFVDFNKNFVQISGILVEGSSNLFKITKFVNFEENETMTGTFADFLDENPDYKKFYKVGFYQYRSFSSSDFMFSPVVESK